MADNLTIPPTGSVVATDDVSSVHFQKIKVDVGGDGATAPLIDAAVPSALLPVGGKVIRVSQTPTVTNGAYSANDAMGGLLTFANAARASGGSCVIEGFTVVDLSNTQPALELLLFDQTFTNIADNGVFDISDADLANVIAVVKFADWASYNDHAVTSRFGLGLACKLAGTSLFGQLMTRTAVTLTSTADIIVVAHIAQN